MTQKFVREYEAKYGKIPSLYGFSMYSGVMWVAEALEKMGGKAEDREALIDTVLKTELTGLAARQDRQARQLRQPALRRPDSQGCEAR